MNIGDTINNTEIITIREKIRITLEDMEETYGTDMIDTYSGTMTITNLDIMSIIIKKDMKKFKNKYSIYQII